MTSEEKKKLIAMLRESNADDFTEKVSDSIEIYISPDGCLNVSETTLNNGRDLIHICPENWPKIQAAVERLFELRSNDPKSPYSQ